MNVQQDNRVVWNLGDRGPDWYGDFEMEVEAAPALVVGSTVTNRLEITNDQGDAHPGDNTFELASTVSSPYLFRVQESHNRVEGNALPNAPVHIVLKDHLGVGQAHDRRDDRRRRDVSPPTTSRTSCPVTRLR